MRLNHVVQIWIDGDPQTINKNIVLTLSWMFHSNDYVYRFRTVHGLPCIYVLSNVGGISHFNGEREQSGLLWWYGVDKKWKTVIKCGIPAPELFFWRHIRMIDVFFDEPILLVIRYNSLIIQIVISNWYVIRIEEWFRQYVPSVGSFILG